MTDSLNGVHGIKRLVIVGLVSSNLMFSVAYADIYRCDNAPGVITLSNVQKDKKCKKMDLPPLEKRAKPKAPDASTAKANDAPAKPAPQKSTFENAQAERKRIIQEELDLEQDRLDAVNNKITALNSPTNKSSNKAKDLAALQKKQSLHQGNIELLQKELKKQ